MSIWSSIVFGTFRCYSLIDFNFGFKFTVANDTNALTETSFHLWSSHGIRQMVNVDGSLAQQGGESLLQSTVMYIKIEFTASGGQNTAQC